MCTPRAGDVFICALPPALVELIGTPDAADPTDDSEIVPDEAPDFRRLLRTRTSGLPEPLPAMPYALVATDGRLFAGLADGQLWEGIGRVESWHACALEGEALMRLNALAHAAA